jgi:hypothetical protein
MLSGEGRGHTLTGSLIPPSLDIEVSFLLTTNLETYATLFEHTTTKLEWEALPFVNYI